MTLTSYPRVNTLVKHYKGGLYKVLMIALDCETKEEVVIYYSIKYQTTWVRKMSEWRTPVEINGVETPRFTLLS